MTYKKGDMVLVITEDGYHKKRGLFIGNKYVIERVATFSNNQCADQFEEFLCRFLDVKEPKG